MLDFDYDEIRKYIEESSPESVIMIGCDSVRTGKPGNMFANYSTVICVRRATGEGDKIMYHGCRVFGTSVRLRDFGVVKRSGHVKNLKLRMMQEVAFALEAFENVWEAIGDRPYEIHLDINPDENYGSSVALKEARGYVLGMTGREPEFKPHALAASFAADAHAHGLLN